jgi:hypothetical protein
MREGVGDVAEDQPEKHGLDRLRQRQERIAYRLHAVPSDGHVDMAQGGHAGQIDGGLAEAGAAAFVCVRQAECFQTGELDSGQRSVHLRVLDRQLLDAPSHLLVQLDKEGPELGALAHPALEALDLEGRDAGWDRSSDGAKMTARGLLANPELDGVEFGCALGEKVEHSRQPGSKQHGLVLRVLLDVAVQGRDEVATLLDVGFEERRDVCADAELIKRGERAQRNELFGICLRMATSATK